MATGSKADLYQNPQSASYLPLTLSQDLFDGTYYLDIIILGQSAVSDMISPSSQILKRVPRNEKSVPLSNLEELNQVGNFFIT